MDISVRLQELNWELPPTPTPAGSYVPAVLHGDLLFVSGQTANLPDLLGKVGQHVSVEKAYEAARLALLRSLAQVRDVLGDLNRVERVVRLTGYVASAPGFNQQPMVVNGASDALLALFGDQGRHARTSVGVFELPGNACVEVDLVLGVKGGEAE